MVDHHHAAVAIHEVREANDAIRRSNNASAVIGRNVHAAMERSFAAERINALAKDPVSLPWTGHSVGAAASRIQSRVLVSRTSPMPMPTEAAPVIAVFRSA